MVRVRMGLGVWAAGQQGSILSVMAFTTARETPWTDTLEFTPDPSATTVSTLTATAPLVQFRKTNPHVLEQANMHKKKCTVKKYFEKNQRASFTSYLQHWRV